jgi:hypothetical protein
MTPIENFVHVYQQAVLHEVGVFFDFDGATERAAIIDTAAIGEYLALEDWHGKAPYFDTPAVGCRVVSFHVTPPSEWQVVISFG